MIEFALSATLLVLMFTGAFQYGYAFLVYNHLQSAVATGARYAATIPYQSSTVSPTPEYLMAVRNMVLYGSPVGGDTPVAPGLAMANVRVSVGFSNGSPSIVTIDIDGYELNALFQNFTLHGKPAVTFPYLGPGEASKVAAVQSASL